MKFVALMYTDPEHTNAMSKAQFDAVMRKHGQLREELLASGELIGGMGMAVAGDTTLLRLGPDGVLAERGPLAAGAAFHLSAYYELGPAAARVITRHPELRSWARGLLEPLIALARRVP